MLLTIGFYAEFDTRTHTHAECLLEGSRGGRYTVTSLDQDILGKT